MYKALSQRPLKPRSPSIASSHAISASATPTTNITALWFRQAIFLTPTGCTFLPSFDKRFRIHSHESQRLKTGAAAPPLVPSCSLWQLTSWRTRIFSAAAFDWWLLTGATSSTGHIPYEHIPALPPYQQSSKCWYHMCHSVCWQQNCSLSSLLKKQKSNYTAEAPDNGYGCGSFVLKP